MLKISTPVFRLYFLSAILLLGLGVLAMKLWLEQIQRSQAHNAKVSRQSIRMIRQPALRGKIYASNLEILADNYPVYHVYLYLAEMRLPGPFRKTYDHIEKVIAQIAASIERPNDNTREDITRHINTKPGLPYVAFKNLSPEEIAKVNTIALTEKGVAIMPDTARIYPYGSLAAHIIGYTRLKDPSQAADRREFFYYIPDQTGVTGIERVFDQPPRDIGLSDIRGLCGLPGHQVVRVDNRGFVDQVLPGGVQPLNGNSIVTTIDVEAQEIAENLLQGYDGAFVLLDARTGEIKALASAPTFSLSDFSPVRNNPRINALNNDPTRPQYNRALLGAYMPGSIIKPLIGLELLEAGISPELTVECTGVTHIGDSKIRCTGIHGDVDLEFGLERSCNAYFNVMGLELGLEKIRAAMIDAGLGTPTDCGLPEASGLLPSAKNKRRPWTPYDNALVSIGQGTIELTPLQAVVYTAAIANGGKLMQPTFLREIRDPEGLLLYRNAPQLNRQMKATPEHLAIIKEGMRRVVNSPRGSGRLAQMQDLTLYGKTGSAEVGVKPNHTKNTFFIAFCYVGEEIYAAIILVVGGDSGGTTCAPLMKRFFSSWSGTRGNTE